MWPDRTLRGAVLQCGNFWAPSSFGCWIERECVFDSLSSWWCLAGNHAASYRWIGPGFPKTTTIRKRYADVIIQFATRDGGHQWREINSPHLRQRRISRLRFMIASLDVERTIIKFSCSRTSAYRRTYANKPCMPGSAKQETKWGWTRYMTIHKERTTTVISAATTCAKFSQKFYSRSLYEKRKFSQTREILALVLWRPRKFDYPSFAPSIFFKPWKQNCWVFHNGAAAATHNFVFGLQIAKSERRISKCSINFLDKFGKVLKGNFVPSCCSPEKTQHESLYGAVLNWLMRTTNLVPSVKSEQGGP